MKIRIPATVAILLGAVLASPRAPAQSVGIARSFDGTRSHAPRPGVTIARDFGADAAHAPVVLADVRVRRPGMAPTVRITASPSMTVFAPIRIFAPVARVLAISAWNGTPVLLPTLHLGRTWR